MGESDRHFLERTRGKLDLAIGLLIGMGGFAELTIIGMITWIIKEIKQYPAYQGKNSWPKDLVAANIGILLILYWNYVDPVHLSSWDIFTNGPKYCHINSILSLTWKEGAKAICFTLFALVCNHTEISRLRKLMKNIALGFLLYVIPTVTGSLLLQGFRMGGNKLYNIFTNDLSAQSTTTGYLVIMAIAILVATKSRLVYPVIALGFISGVQASDKGVLLISFSALMYLCGSKLLENKLAITKYREIAQWSVVGLLGTIVSITIKYGSNFQNYVLTALGERYTLYIEGYGKLIEYLAEPSNNIYAYVGIRHWWHSVPLDAIRAAGLIGAVTSFLWLGIIVLCAIVFCVRNDYQLVFLSLAVLFIYMTSLPLHTGAYEFMGLATGTILMINELWKNQLQVTLNSQKHFR